MLFLAALTSAISILEVITAYYIDEGLDRTRATIFFGLIITIVGIFCSLSNGSFDDFSILFGHSFMDLLDIISSKYMLPIGGLFTGLFVLIKWGVPKFLDELNVGIEKKLTSNNIIISFLISIIVVGFIILNEIIEVVLGSPIIS